MQDPENFQSTGSVEKRGTVNRRTFVAASVAMAGTLAVPNLRIPKRTLPDKPIVGEGEFKYECTHNWGDLPSGHHYGEASHGVCIDKQGLIYIAHQGQPASIFVFDSEGKFIKSFGKEFVSAGHGIDIREENGQEFLYVSPADPRFGFAKMDLKGETVWLKDRKKIADETSRYPDEKNPFRPTNASFSPDGGFFLGDGYGSGLVHQYDAKGEFIRTIDGSNGAGRLATPHGHWLDDRDGVAKLAVCDRASKRLQFFDMDGKFLYKLDGFLFPAHIDIRGEVMMVPDLHCRVTLLDKNNKVLTHLGEDEAWRNQALEGFKMRSQSADWKPGKFIHPHDACFDKDGNIYVAEWVVTGRITKLHPVG